MACAKLDLIKRFVRDNGYTLTYAASQLGVSKTSLSRIFAGDSTHQSASARDAMIARGMEWMEAVYAEETALYDRLIEVLHGVDGRTAVNVLQHVTQDKGLKL